MRQRPSQQRGLSQTTRWRILRKLKLLDHGHGFADFSLEHFKNDNDFIKKIIFSDESYLHLSCAVNEQKYRFCCEKQFFLNIHEKPLHLLKLIVLCGFWFVGFNDPHFFRNEGSNTATAKG